MTSESEPLRIALLSSTRFGHQCLLDGIIGLADCKVVGILTTPGSIDIGKTKEQMVISSSADFRSVARDIGCELLSLESRPETSDYITAYERWRPEVVLVLGWYHLIPRAALKYPRLETLGIHASLLPRYRGMAPVSWALINGEKESGVTLFYLDETVDGGDVVAQQSIPIAFTDDCASLYDKVTDSAIELLKKYLPLIANGSAPRHAQDEKDVTCFPRRSPEDGLIDWNWSARRIHDFVRAQTRPYPGAYTWVGEHKMYVWRVESSDINAVESDLPGKIMRRHGQLEVATGDGILRLCDVEMVDPALGNQCDQLLSDGVAIGGRESTP